MVSAPGKVILMGEHAAVYGVQALVAAVELRTRVRLEVVAGAGVELDLVDLGRIETLSWDQVFQTTQTARGSWLDYARAPSLEAMAALRSSDPSRLVQVALGEALEEFVDAPLPGMRLRVQSDIPIGAGFGSSASVAVAVAGAVSDSCTGGLDFERIARVALESERRQHGSPSGIDHMTVLRGGVLEVLCGAGEQRSVRTVTADSGVLECLDLYDTGTPQESTGWIVAAVRESFRGRESARDAVLAAIATAVNRLTQQLNGAFDVVAVAESFRACQRALEELGVVPRVVREIVAAVESLGGAAKVSGAGSLAGPAAGALLVFSPPGLAAATRAAVPFRRLRVELGSAGLRQEASV